MKSPNIVRLVVLISVFRGFLGRMLFAGDDGVKKVKVLSGGEKVRCLLSKMMTGNARL